MPDSTLHTCMRHLVQRCAVSAKFNRWRDVLCVNVPLIMTDNTQGYGRGLGGHRHSGGAVGPSRSRGVRAACHRTLNSCEEATSAPRPADTRGTRHAPTLPPPPADPQVPEGAGEGRGPTGRPELGRAGDRAVTGSTRPCASQGGILPTCVLLRRDSALPPRTSTRLDRPHLFQGRRDFISR